jgi:4-hydroxybenzoate polyprenyltransferase
VVAVSARSTARRALEPIRAGEWWEHKLAPMLGTGYMTAFHLGSPLLRLLPMFVGTVVAVAAAAAYVSLVNDLADRDEDAAAGKANRLAGRTRRYAAGAFGATVAVGLAAAIVTWHADPLALALYAGSWLAFTLYSLPPVRLKARGLAGALADASGAALFPQLLVTVAVFHAAGVELERSWLAAVGVWALATGLRGALWHQLGDVEADTRSGAGTYGSLRPARARLVGQTAFAVEMSAFVVLLWWAGSPLAFALLVAYALLELARKRLWGVHLLVVSPASLPYRIAMHDYYVCLYPLAFLISSTVRHPGDAIVLAVQVAAFPTLLVTTARDAVYAILGVASGLRAAA